MRHLWNFTALSVAALGGCYTTAPKTTLSTSSPGTTLPPTTPTVPTTALNEDRIVQTGNSAVDILFVVQNTPDMADAQGELLAQAPVLLDYLLGTSNDWHLGAVTSDLSDPLTAGVLLDASGQQWIDATTPNPMSLLSQLVSSNVGTLSTPMSAAYEALETRRDTDNFGFYREDAALEVVVLSDGTDQSSLTTADFAGWLDGLGDKSVSYHCLVAGTGTACEDVTSTVGGHTGDVGDTSLYEEIGLSAAGLSRMFPLSALPEVETIEVDVEDPTGALLSFLPAEFNVNGDIIGGDWLYNADTNSIEFLAYIPSFDATIVIRYASAP